MRQVLVESINQISVEEVPVPAPASGEVLVRSTVVGICGSDMHAALGKHPFIDLPYQPGHEIVGVIEEVGPGAGGGIRQGDRVVVEPNLVCGKCAQCTSGRYNICQELKVFGCQTTGGMADWFTIAADRVHLLPETLSDMDAALVEPLATAVHAVRRAGDLSGRRVVVLGAGPVGLLVLAAVAQTGAALIASTDLLDSKRQRALRLGADVAIPADAIDFATRTQEALGGPADIVFDCVAIEASMNQAIDVVDKGGTVVVVGVPAGAIRVRLDLVQDREISVIGTLMYVGEDMRKAISLVNAGVVTARDLVTATYPLDEAAQAFHTSHDPEHVKVLVTVTAR
jgi:2-desacetyl-2-hydroxyethyl bacteriochlorophyllide A dehydrogenase